MVEGVTTPQTDLDALREGSRCTPAPSIPDYLSDKILNPPNKPDNNGVSWFTKSATLPIESTELKVGECVEFMHRYSDAILFWYDRFVEAQNLNDSSDNPLSLTPYNFPELLSTTGFGGLLGKYPQNKARKLFLDNLQAPVKSLLPLREGFEYITDDQEARTGMVNRKTGEELPSYSETRHVTPLSLDKFQPIPLKLSKRKRNKRTIYDYWLLVPTPKGYNERSKKSHKGSGLSKKEYKKKYKSKLYIPCNKTSALQNLEDKGYEVYGGELVYSSGKLSIRMFVRKMDVRSDLNTLSIDNVVAFSVLPTLDGITTSLGLDSRDEKDLDELAVRVRNSAIKAVKRKQHNKRLVDSRFGGKPVDYHTYKSLNAKYDEKHLRNALDAENLEELQLDYNRERFKDQKRRIAYKMESLKAENKKFNDQIDSDIIEHKTEMGSKALEIGLGKSDCSRSNNKGLEKKYGPPLRSFFNRKFDSVKSTGVEAVVVPNFNKAITMLPKYLWIQEKVTEYTLLEVMREVAVEKGLWLLSGDFNESDFKDVLTKKVETELDSSDKYKQQKKAIIKKGKTSVTATYGVCEENFKLGNKRDLACDSETLHFLTSVVLQNVDPGNNSKYVTRVQLEVLRALSTIGINGSPVEVFDSVSSRELDKIRVTVVNRYFIAPQVISLLDSGSSVENVYSWLRSLDVSQYGVPIEYQESSKQYLTSIAIEEGPLSTDSLGPELESFINSVRSELSDLDRNHNSHTLPRDYKTTDPKVKYKTCKVSSRQRVELFKEAFPNSTLTYDVLDRLEAEKGYILLACLTTVMAKGFSYIQMQDRVELVRKLYTEALELNYVSLDEPLTATTVTNVTKADIVKSLAAAEFDKVTEIQYKERSDLKKRFRGWSRASKSNKGLMKGLLELPGLVPELLLCNMNKLLCREHFNACIPN